MSWDLTSMFPVTLAQTSDVAPESTPAAPSNGGGETTGQDGAAGGTGGPPLDQSNGGSGGGNMMLIMLAVLAVMFIFMMGGQRKEKKKRAELLASIKKGDKVQTVGGILGTIVEVRDDRVIVKIDENTNTRVPFARSAIQNVIRDSEGEEKK